MKKLKYYNAILELTKEKGLAAISVRDIANHLNISTGSLYYQFDGKNDLLNKMFIYYKQEFSNFLDTLDNDTHTIVSNYLEYNMNHHLQFKFVYSGELSELLNEESLRMSLATHLKLLDKLGLDYDQDSHIITIVLGTIRAYLFAPSYMKRCDQQLLVEELVKIINNYQKTPK